MAKTVVLDFDGVLHTYKAKWIHAGIISDGAVPGAMQFILDLLAAGYVVAIFSSRSSDPRGVSAMRLWLHEQMTGHLGAESIENHKFPVAEAQEARKIVDSVRFPADKPPAVLTIDDRGFHFVGEFPSLDYIENFVPWNKVVKEVVA